MKALDGKTAMVTGGGSGIGLAIARLFAREGARIVIQGRRERELEEAVAEIGSGAVAFLGDVTDSSDRDRAVELVSERFGGLDIYVANAGTNTLSHTSAVDEEAYDRQFDLNARGVFFGVQKMMPLLRDGGAIILTGSIASDKVLENHTVYAGSKAAIVAFARSWALELSSRGIRVNVLSPGPTDTPILGKQGILPQNREAFEAEIAAAIPLGRLGRPEEVARAALFLASDAGSFVTGVNLRVDGGMSLR